MTGNTTLTVVQQGWVDEPYTRGTWSIISTCLLTIILCCWTAVLPNIPARNDRWYDRLRDRLHLFSIGLLGPEFLLMLALGQWSSARASVNNSSQGKATIPWTLTHAFYADMGGFVLNGEGIDSPFPVNAEQLFFLVKEKYIDYPEVTEDDIKDRNKSDGFSRVIAACQTLWFVVNSTTRVAQGLFLTTLELTTISFVVVFLVTSYSWKHKPSNISSTIPITTKTPIDAIREKHCDYPDQPWHETPLDFACHDVSFCQVHWRHYTRLLQKMHLSIFSRPMTARPRNRIPSDNFLGTDLQADIVATPTLIVVGVMFMFAWNSHFPSRAEHILWRTASIYNLVFTIVAGLHAGYCDKVLLPGELKKARSLPWYEPQRPPPPPPVSRKWDFWRRLAIRMRNLDPSRNPRSHVPLRVLLPTTVLCALYCLGRGYILVEDCIGLPKLPESAFRTVSWSVYVPHL
ncbi:uncharacterized protein BP01DRAFT_315212 [Aspergillus saccharolyticus JOP 1030-1]|uniref:Uncharacterized protein n=1 Tax=Aspergillus saccharolyticus JOP 1030-1 TaxID=1450539 RepID=A0A318ZJV1_9EURO|nr:hypothetical protein BP01DRAFT_315212 [Aspergillus saccharolyticus JOP 1030-1]PYH47127.1 hypothetical protein BP01DRAFT_315212 [Aspergillus saccharolyticus JOP 1030-1]